MKDFETGLTAKDVRGLFRYVKSTDKLIRKTPVFGRGSFIQYPVGSVAGSLHRDGYFYVAVNRRLYMAHRLAYLIVTGEWPLIEIDHRNGMRSDNRWRNIRPASVAQNRSNTLGHSTRLGPHPGVYVRRLATGSIRHIAQIKHKKKVIYLGSFSNAIDAKKARIAAELKYFGEFAGSLRGQL